MTPTQNDGSVNVAFTHLPDLANERMGGRALYTNDDFFAEKENLVKHERPVFIADKYTDRGKWMDGWESRRRRTPGFDFCLVKLGMPGVIRGLDVDTAFFTGNYPEYARVLALDMDSDGDGEALATRDDWTELVPKSALRGGSRNLFPVTSEKVWTHLRLEIYPDGGVARLRVHGEVKPKAMTGQFDLAALENGARVVVANDAYFGPRDNLIAPGDAKTMGEGWETRRRRRPGNDWCVVKLARPGVLRRAIIDTSHFKGNFPDGASLEGVMLTGHPTEDHFTDAAVAWREILPRQKLKADTKHSFEIPAHEPISHVRLSIYPDGGVARLRLFGEAK